MQESRIEEFRKRRRKEIIENVVSQATVGGWFCREAVEIAGQVGDGHLVREILREKFPERESLTGPYRTKEEWEGYLRRVQEKLNLTDDEMAEIREQTEDIVQLV